MNENVASGQLRVEGRGCLATTCSKSGRLRRREEEGRLWWLPVEGQFGRPSAYWLRGPQEASFGLWL
jgi:hypothetical protein